MLQLSIRKFVVSTSEEAWVSGCTCNLVRLNLFDGLADTVDDTLQGALMIY